jgi:hypothetical protein
MWWRSEFVVCADPIAGRATRTVARTTWIAFMTVFSRVAHCGFDLARRCDTEKWTHATARSCEEVSNYISSRNRNFYLGTV